MIWRRLYQEQLSIAQRQLSSLLTDTDSNLDLLSNLSKTFTNVDVQAEAFQARCESLLAEQQRLSSIASDVGQNLQYYNYLDPITRRLNAPGVRHFVRSGDFSEMLAQLDECLVYMKEHVRHSNNQNHTINEQLTHNHFVAQSTRVLNVRVTV